MYSKDTRRRRIRRITARLIGFSVAITFCALFLAVAPEIKAASDKINLIENSSATQSGPIPHGWEFFSFRKKVRHTQYKLINGKDFPYIHAVSINSASAIVKNLGLDPKTMPVLRWKWKIGKTLPEGDASKKKGADFAARVFVMFKYDPEKAGPIKKLKYALGKMYYGHYPPEAAINYIWANKLPVGESVRSAYTDRTVLVSMRRGDSMAGTWLFEKVDIVADYRKYFNEEPPVIEGIAIMTDSDDTEGGAEAWYADINLSGE